MKPLRRSSTSRMVESRLPCPDVVNCGSSDAYALYDDGHGFCFSCSKSFKNEEVKLENDNVEFVYMEHRGIPKRVWEFYGVLTKLDNGVPDSVGFPYGEEAAKIRLLHGPKNQQFSTRGPIARAGVFGKDRFDPGSKDSITICEGEPDALAAYEMLRGKSACVSVQSASSAYRDCVTDWEYINSFDRIYLCLDNDKAGQDATKQLAGLFDFRKTYHVKFHKYKDANDYILAKEHDTFEKVWSNAKRFAPDNIISAFKDIEKALEESQEDQVGEYPFPELNDKLYGFHKGEVVVIKAPEGVGKTEFFRAIEHHQIKNGEFPIGIIHLEEDNGTTVKAIAGYELGIPAVLPDCGLSKDDILAAYKRAVKDDEGRVHIHSSFDLEDEETFWGNVRFLVSAAGCRAIFLDHITWLATGEDQNEDERRKLDRISQRGKLLAKELGFTLFEIAHVNDDGKTRGSRNISKVANTVISLHRDLLAGENTVQFMIEKARLGGRTGPAGQGYFNRLTGRLEAEAPAAYLPEEV